MHIDQLHLFLVPDAVSNDAFFASSSSKDEKNPIPTDLLRCTYPQVIGCLQIQPTLGLAAEISLQVQGCIR
jgi:hypothetical protein